MEYNNNNNNNNNEDKDKLVKFTAPPSSTLPASTSTTSLSDQIATAALSAFASLPKTGKPQPFEHTAFAAIALTFPPHGHAATCLGLPNSTINDDKSSTTSSSTPLIVALATGTKCLPGSKRAVDGSALNDCHAEVLARRAYLRWLYDEIQHAVGGGGGSSGGGASESDKIVNGGGSLVFSIINGKVELTQGVKIHMFASHPPCGDAAIGAEQGHTTAVGQAQDQPSSCGCPDPSNLHINTSNTTSNIVGRTGAKPLIKRQKINDDDGKITIPDATNTTKTTATTVSNVVAVNNSSTGGVKDEWLLPQAHDVESYALAQMPGVVRRKPGRGDPTLSVSCSDKIAKWSLLGLQGAFLSSLLENPLFFTSLVVGAPVVSNIGSSSTINTNSTSMSTPQSIEMTENALKRAFQDRTASLRSRLSASSSSSVSSFLPPPLVLETHAVALDASELDTLGLLAGEVRRVPCGASITWRAGPSATWRLKAAKYQWGSIGGSGGGGGAAIDNKVVQSSASLPPSAPIFPSLVITEGFSEAITGLFGCKAGAARRGADPIPPERQSALCRAALFERFIQVSTALGNNNKFDASISNNRNISYAEAKEEAGTSSGYKLRWNEILAHGSPFDGWIKKPSHLGSDFYIDR